MKKQEDIIRVLRVIQYVGPRKSVEEQVAKSIHGSRRGIDDIVISAVTIGEFPEVLEDWQPPDLNKLNWPGYQSQEFERGYEAGAADERIKVQREYANGIMPGIVIPSRDSDCRANPVIEVPTADRPVTGAPPDIGNRK